MKRPLLAIAITGTILAILAWNNPAHAGYQTVVVCTPTGGCTPVVIQTQDPVDTSGTTEDNL